MPHKRKGPRKRKTYEVVWHEKGKLKTRRFSSGVAAADCILALQAKGKTPYLYD